MVTKKIFGFIAILLSGFFIIGCHKNCDPKSYDLNGGISNFFPSKDSIHIGDTLWFASSVPVDLKYWNYTGNDSVFLNMSGAENVATDIHFITFPQKNLYLEALDSFKLIPIKGQIQVNPLAPHGAETVNFVEEQGSFVVSFGIVAQKRGVFCITILDIDFARKNCIEASITIPINDTVNQHLYFLDSVYFPGSRYEPAIPNYELTHDYCFKVY